MNKQIYKKYAEILLKVGVNFQAGQNLIVNAPPQAYELVREIAELAYCIGAVFVKAEFEDREINAIRLRNSDIKDISYFPEWMSDYLASYIDGDVAMIYISSPSPKLYENIDSDKITAFQNGVLMGNTKFREANKTKSIHTVSTCFPSTEWAEAVYPELDGLDALKKLWEDVIEINRLSAPDPVEAWQEHKKEMKARKDILAAMHIDKLIFSGPDTSLELKIIENSAWGGGYYCSGEKGLQIVPNMPTEEIFAVPHKYGVNGKVTSTLPLNYEGNIIEKISLTFREGKIVEYSSATCHDVLKNLIETDEGTRYLGEVALVSVESPIYKTGNIFYTTLYDENAVCHIAIGNSIASVVSGSHKLSDEEKDAVGLNVSSKHVDIMVGSSEVSVDAVLSDGSVKRLLNKGKWSLEE